MVTRRKRLQLRGKQGRGGERGEIAGVEEHEKMRHNDDEGMITMTMLPLPLPPADNLKKNNQLNWEDAVGK
jgi:hypothetical protein